MKRINPLHPFASKLPLIAALMLGCASTPGAKADDMSADEHRAHAAQERAEAGKHDAQYDPSARQEQAIQAGGSWEVTDYNPTAGHSAEASVHRGHAGDHLAAAQELEQFEEAECSRFPAATRKVCPLLNTVSAVEDIEGGVRVRLADGVNTHAALDHVRCHLAFARKQGRKGMDRCPLYLAGVAAKAGSDTQTIDLSIEAAESLPALRRRAREHVAPKGQ